MAKEFTGVSHIGENWNGSASDFQEDLDDAKAIGFVSGDTEYEWYAAAEIILKTAQGLEHVFGKVEWLGRDGGRTILLVVG